MAYNKHVGIYQSKDDLLNNISELTSPWVAYVMKENNGYDVYYSNDMIVSSNHLNIAEKLNERVTKLEQEIVLITLTETEYETLITLEDGVEMEITDVDGSKKNISYNPSAYYYTYDPSDLSGE